MKTLAAWPLALIIFLFASPALSSNKIIFEGYFKISLFNKHVGYYIQRYEIDQKKKRFVSTYFLKTNQEGGNISESLKATSTESLMPLYYQYTSLQGKKSKTIDAKVVGGKMTVNMTEGGRPRTYEKPIKKGTFFSTFLTFLILQGEKGMKPGVKYDYVGVAEEDGLIHKGTAYIEKEEAFKGIPAYKILNTFKNSQFVNYVNKKGESLKSYSPTLGLGAEIVANPDEATKGFVVDSSTLKLLFGSHPTGLVNELSKANSAPAALPQTDNKKPEKGK